MNELQFNPLPKSVKGFTDEEQEAVRELRLKLWENFTRRGKMFLLIRSRGGTPHVRPSAKVIAARRAKAKAARKARRLNRR